MRSRLAVAALFAAAIGFFAPLAVVAQSTPAAGNEPIRVFIDCSYQCDENFLKTEVNWVAYVRDRADAQVHVLVTSQGTGGGGTRFTLNFIGLREFAALNDTLVYTSPADASNDVRRRGLTKTIANGLVPFVARTPMGEQLSIRVPPPGEGGARPGGPAAAAAPRNDPWNFWTFRIGMSGNGNGESQSKSYRVSGNVSANRTTDEWKINLGANGNYNERKVDYTGIGVDYKNTTISKSASASTLVVKSLGPHLSAGLRAGANTSTYGNTSLGLNFSPAVEYNLIPYSESTRRSFIFRYTAGVRYADYREITIYDKTEETRPSHSVEVEYSRTEPWGSVSLFTDFSQYLHDTQKYNAGLGAFTDLRLFKGFSLNLGGNYSRVRDQLSLPGRDLTEEEILLQQRQLATNYSYFLSVGISYRFGSIFNSVVNPRFGGGGGGMVMFFEG